MRHKLEISDPTVAAEVVAQGGRLLADYGGFQLYGLDQPNAEILNHRNIQLRDQYHHIRLKAAILDTRQPQAQSLRRMLGVYPGKRLHLVQLVGPPLPAWHKAVLDTGVEIVSYIPQNSYLIYGDAPSLGQLQDLARAADYVQWDGEYLDDYKVHPKARAVDPKGNPRKIETDWFAIQLVADGAANPATFQVIEQLSLSPIRNQFDVLNYRNIIARLSPGRLKEIASRPDVISIEPYPEHKKYDERQDQIVAGNLAGNSPIGPGYLNWLSSKGFSQAQFAASGFAVDVSDSGIDNATTSPNHFGLYEAGDLGLASRVIYSRLEGAPNSGSTRQGCDGHGNLNAHIVAGYNDRPNGFPHTDAAGYHYGLGVCPFVKVGSSVIFDPDKFTYPNFVNLQSKAYHDGARISANSWGADTEGEYNIVAQAYDALVRDAQPAGSSFPVAGNQQMVIVFAAGNSGDAAQTVGSPGTAKNVIAVGAAENVHSHSTANGGNNAAGNDGCNLNDTDAGSANDLAGFSSRGPCADGRKKPELVAPGTHITGGVAQDSPPPLPTATGNDLACFNASGVCALPGGGTAANGNNFFPLGQRFYTTSSGTSHSAPAVAGGCALVRQYFINNSLNPPSPAMTKACLINSTRYMTGVGANDTLWSDNQGMGEMNLGFAFDGTPRILRDQLSIDKFGATGQTRTFIGTIVDPGKPFRVTVAWTDAPGSITGDAFNNDLDLTVTVGGNTYHGNVFNGANSVPGGVADPRDNVECVFLPAGASCNFVVTITAANINSDGVPNEPPSLDQDFALVVYNAVPGSGPVLSADSIHVIAENCSPTNNAVDPYETVTMNVVLRNVGSSDIVNLVASLQEAGGVGSPSGPQAYGALVAGGAPAARSYSFTANTNCGTSLTATLQLQDGATSLCTATFVLPLGQVTNFFTQNFDGVAAPNLPAGWTTSKTGAQSLWVTASSAGDTLPNAAFSPDPAAAGVNELVTPIISIPIGSGQLSFRNNYDLEEIFGNAAFDGGVLEIKIACGQFTDILDAGGSFVSGGYTHALTTSANPLSGRPAWSGNSGGFITTLVNLPPAASGQNIQLRWRCGSDESVSRTGWHIDTVAVSGRLCCGTPLTLLPLVISDTLALTAENCPPANGAVDPGETVTMNFALKNIGSVNSSNIVATLQAANGITSPSGPQNYGALTACGATVSRPFTFTVSGNCGATNIATFRLQDGAIDLGTTTFNVQLGQISGIFSQNFDGVTAPALPAGWTTSASDGQSAWVTSSSTRDTSPNSAFSPDPATAGVNELVSAVTALPSGSSRLSFRNNYVLEAGSGSTAFDGAVLEIKIGAGAFTDVIDAGGSFVSGGYTHTISGSYGNPLAGRQAWSGSSGGFITTRVNLPAAASDQNIQLRWRCGSDSSSSDTGWNVDTVVIEANACCDALSPPVAAFSATPTSGAFPTPAAFNDTSTGMITNRFWSFGNGATTNTTATNFVYTYNAPGTYTVTLTVRGPHGTNSVIRPGYITVTNPLPVVVSNAASVLAESCSSTNNAADPDETVTFNFSLKNVGSGNTTNLVATLLANGGVLFPSGPQTYGVLLAGGAAVARPFSFTASGSCGATNLATLQLQDDGADLGTISFAFALGQNGSVLAQNFDGVAIPSLPAGWTTSASGGQSNWVTSTTFRDTLPNAAFSPDTASVGVNELVSPAFPIALGGAQLTFRQRYNLEVSSGGITFDGAVLEIKIGGGGFTDIVTAGGSFVSGGYTHTVNSSYGNPLAGRQAWGGSSSGFITTVVNLPAAAAGQNVQLRWRCGCDSSTGSAGWYVDTIAVTGRACCLPPPYIVSQPQSQTVLVGDNAAFNVTASGVPPLSYQWRFNANYLAGATASGYTRTNAQPTNTGNYSVVITNMSGSITSAVATLTVLTRPILLNPQITTNGVFGFTLSGDAGRTYVVEVTTNLAVWTPRATLTNVTGLVPFTETNGLNLATRFYRAKVAP